MDIITDSIKSFSGFNLIKSYLRNLTLDISEEIPGHINEIIKKIQKMTGHREVHNFLFEQVETGELEMKNGVLFKKGEFTIQNLFKNQGIEYEQNLKKLNSLNLSIVPQHITTIVKDNDMFIINRIKGTKSGDLIPYFFGKNRVSQKDKENAYRDLQKLTKSGFIDDKIAASSDLWFVTPDNNKIMLPSFEALRRLRTNENQKALSNYHKIIFAKY